MLKFVNEWALRLSVQLMTRQTIEATIAGATNEKTFKAALGAWIKDSAIQSGLNYMTPSQYSEIAYGTSLARFDLSRKLFIAGS